MLYIKADESYQILKPATVFNFEKGGDDVLRIEILQIVMFS